jgi:hypothetical protein
MVKKIEIILCLIRFHGNKYDICRQHIFGNILRKILILCILYEIDSILINSKTSQNKNTYELMVSRTGR